MGKTVVIVGGSSGIGLGVAAAALEAGAQVTIAGRSADKLAAAARALGAGDRLQGLVADMTDEADVARMVDTVGAFDHFIATAGTLPPGDPIERTDIEAVRGFVDSKLVGAILLAKHAVRRLKPGGSITFTSGINKDRPPMPGGAMVSAIAGSFDFLVRALAVELAPTRVNVVSPGWVDTPMWDVVGDVRPAMFADLADRLPARRVPTARDVARAYLYLMESPFTTGETLRIDGGQSLV
jgi:NAD(P)-dependent dehydrogenase (short-subunit alcohol dehydrogenase family)